LGSFHLTVYSSPNDKALELSTILFGSAFRLGRLTGSQLSSPDFKALFENTQIAGVADFIEYRGRVGFAGHSYFRTDPKVEQDLAALIRDRVKAGDPGRPLVEIKRPFWRIGGPPGT
jgi:esterase/lipase superfamily enzyme